MEAEASAWDAGGANGHQVGGATTLTRTRTRTPEVSPRQGAQQLGEKGAEAALALAQARPPGG